MDSRMTLQVAQEHIADLRRAADATGRHVNVPDEHELSHVIALRTAWPDEARELRQLAALDSAEPLRGESLVALVDGRLVAAISLNDGRVIADPMVATADVRALLRKRAGRLAPSPRRRWPRLRPRLV
jgi:hypothetical protein